MGELCPSLPCYCTHSPKNGIYALVWNSAGRQITDRNKSWCISYSGHIDWQLWVFFRYLDQSSSTSRRELIGSWNCNSAPSHFHHASTNHRVGGANKPHKLRLWWFDSVFFNFFNQMWETHRFNIFTTDEKSLCDILKISNDSWFIQGGSSRVKGHMYDHIRKLQIFNMNKYFMIPLI